MAEINKSVLKPNANKIDKPVSSPLAVMVNSANVQERFNKMLGDKSAGFLSSLLTLVNNNKLLANSDPKSVLAAAATAASLDLPINPSLGFAWIVPYKGAAQFQMGWKGLTQLAQRSGLMKSIVVVEVYEGELKKWNKFTEEFELGEKISDHVIGYYASFTLVNGFKKAVYWTHDEVIKHAKRFSKAFNSGPWQTDQIAMCKKTVLSNLLRTYAPLSIEMQISANADGKVVTMNEATGEAEYTDVEAEEISEAEVVDAGDGRMVNTETGELFNG